MPILNLLEFAKSQLTVSYRGSSEPQTLEIKVACAKKPPDGNAAGILRHLVDPINCGAAGGADFAPTLGHAEVRSGPVRSDAPDAVSAKYHWKIEVVAVSPRYLRSFIEHLRIAASPALVKSMSLVGSLNLDKSALSVTEVQVKAWLDDPRAYPGEWSTPGFPHELRERNKGAAIRLKLKGAATDEILEAFSRQVASTWAYVISDFVNRQGTGPGMISVGHEAKRSKSELTVSFEKFDIAREPARWMLVNLMSRFHEKVAPIAQAEIALA